MYSKNTKYQSKLNLENRTPLQEIIPLETPFVMHLDSSTACNFKCEFCPSASSTNKDYVKMNLDLDLYKKAIDDLKDFNNNLKILRFYKIGEPLMNRNIAEMVAYARNSNKVDFIDMTTNGSLLTNELSLKLVDAGLNKINISIEGINSEQYNKYAHYNINFNEFINNLAFLYKNKKNLEITMKIPGDYLSESEKEEFLNIFSPYCDKIFIEYLTDNVWPNFSVNENSKVINLLGKSQYGLEVKNRKICCYLFYVLVLNSNGTISACCSDWQEKLIIGDVRKQSLKEIWNSDKMNEFRILHLKGKRFENDVCKNCGNIQSSQIDDIDDYAEEILSRMTRPDQTRPDQTRPNIYICSDYIYLYINRKYKKIQPMLQYKIAA
ncbi:radical SAM protein [Brachyspira hyodysenteriae]|uniref:radical SAM protein n=3 Tax=Brachyspira hyodysenteriae TaxID=159 RepID=UPI003A802784